MKPLNGLRDPEKASSLVTFALGSILAGFLLGVGMTIGEGLAGRYIFTTQLTGFTTQVKKQG